MSGFLRKAVQFVTTFPSLGRKQPTLAVPDLFDEPDSEILYQALIMRLNPDLRPQLVEEVCQRIQLHASSRNIPTPPFAFAWRIHALAVQQKYDEALTITQDLESSVGGQVSELPPRSIDYQTMELMRWKYGPLLYFMARYEAAKSIFDCLLYTSDAADE